MEPERAPRGRAAAGPGGPRPVLLLAIVLVAVLVLSVLLGGGVLVLRALAPSAPSSPSTPSAPQPSSTASQGAPGTARIGGARVTEISTEVGVRGLGAGSSRIEPEGEFIIVVLEIADPETPVTISRNVTLETADGAIHEVAGEATRSHRTDDSRPYGVVAAGESGTFHQIYDVPIGSRPSALRLELGPADASGALPLGD